MLAQEMTKHGEIDNLYLVKELCDKLESQNSWTMLCKGELLHFPLDTLALNAELSWECWVHGVLGSCF